MKSGNQTALRVSFLNIVLNCLLAVVKLIVGALCGSGALVSDGIHSVTDVVSTVVVAIGIKLSERSSDGKHPYGHERMECVAAVLLSVLIGITGVGIAFTGIRHALEAGSTVDSSPGRWAVTVAVASVVIKEIMFRYTRRAARMCGSGALLADAWHLRSDALASVGSVVGVIGAYFGLPMLDSIASVVIGLFVLKAAVEIFVDAMRKMTDRACEEELQEEMVRFVTAYPAVVDVLEIKTRLFGNRVLAEITVAVEETLSCREAFEVAQTIEQTVCECFETVKHCAVHIHPVCVQVSGCKSSIDVI